MARIRFDSGVELVVEGPAELRLESIKAASWWSGKVVFPGGVGRGAVRDPHAVVDLGRYGHGVRRRGEGPQREELHVFAGEVQRSRSGAQTAAGAEVVALRARPAGMWPTGESPARS